MVVSAGKPWTPEEDEHLLSLKAAGKRPAVIAKELRRTEASVLGRLSAIKKRAVRSQED
jgi:hypothetical protein